MDILGHKTLSIGVMLVFPVRVTIIVQTPHMQLGITFLQRLLFHKSLLSLHIIALLFMQELSPAQPFMLPQIIGRMAFSDGVK